MQQTSAKRQQYFYFVVHSDRNSGSSDMCCCMLEVLHRVIAIFSLTSVSAGQASALRFWQSCRKSSTVMGDVPQWHIVDSPVRNFVNTPILR